MARDLHQIGATGDDGDEIPEPPRLRRLRLLVTVLMVTMILAMVIVAGALVYRVTNSGKTPSAPPIAGEIAVPEGYEVLSVSRAGDRLYLLMQHRDDGKRIIEERNAGDRRLIGRYTLVPVEAE